MNLGTAWLLNGVLVVTSMQSESESLAFAKDQFERGDCRSAISSLSAALTASPHDARLSHWRSRCYLEQEDYARAISDAERAASESPDNSEYRRWLGRAYGGAAEQARSISLARKVRLAFEQAVQLDPSNLAARRDLIEFYLEAPWIIGGGSRKALKQVEAIADLDAVAGYLAHAAYSRHEKRLEKRMPTTSACWSCDPAGIDPYLEAAGFYEARGDARHSPARSSRPFRSAERYTALLLQRGRAGARESESCRGRPVLPHLSGNAPRRSDFLPTRPRTNGSVV